MYTATSRQQADHVLNLRAGEWVQVRSAEEILATLDERQALDGLPFMPEMLQYCGKTFRVYKSAHKTCDTVREYTIRRMTATVHLEELRCDGGSHGGCQAGCLLYWKEAWLRRAAPGDGVERGDARPGEERNRVPAAAAHHWATLELGTRVAAPAGEASERFRCQATDLLTFTSEVRRRDRWDPRFYLKDLTSGNVPLRDFLWYGLIAMFNSFTIRWFGRRYPHLCGGAPGGQTPAPGGHIQAGETVQVRSKQEILATLGPNLRNRGLSFDVEMVPYCEKSTHKVLRQVERIVDEKTGLLIKLPNPCLILDGVTCSGNLSSERMFCPRHIYPYWRAIWLKSVDGQARTDAARSEAPELAHSGVN